MKEILMDMSTDSLRKLALESGILLSLGDRKEEMIEKIIISFMTGDEVHENAVLNITKEKR